METNGIDNNESRNVISTEATDELSKQQPKTEAASVEKAGDVDDKNEEDGGNGVDPQKGAAQIRGIAQSNRDNVPVAENANIQFVNGDGNAQDLSSAQQHNTLPTSSTKALSSKPHPLKSKWTFWFLNNKKDLDWLERLSEVCTVSTVEEFWAFFDNIRSPSGMFGCDYNFFRIGIDPMWEVEQNKDGGRLVVQVDKQRGDLLDSWWMEFLLACIGEQFGEDSNQVCGVVCNIRQKGSKISIWTTSAMEEEKNRRIGHVIKERLLEAPNNANVAKSYLKIHFEDHATVQQKTSSAIPSRFVL